MFNIREGISTRRDPALPPDALFKHLTQHERVHELLLAAGHELVEPILAQRAGNERASAVEMFPPPMAASVWCPFWLSTTVWLVPTP
jgi:hypothetical protein